IYYFFFFQAEDGIRDRNVTGVQTCALPICCRIGNGVGSSSRARRKCSARSGHFEPNVQAILRIYAGTPTIEEMVSFSRDDPERRSEERRVGKEWRARGSEDHEKKKKETE